MSRLRHNALVIFWLAATTLRGVAGDLDGYFKLEGSEGRGFYRIEAFDGPEFVTVLKPTTNVFGSAGLPDKVRERNPKRNSLGSVVLFSRTPPSAGAEFTGALHEVSCNVPGVPETFYVTSADLKRGILTDPAGFFYPQVAQNIRAFKTSGGTMLPASASIEISAGKVVGVGPSSILTLRQDGSILVRELSYDEVAADENVFGAVSELGLFVAHYCAYLARTRPPDAPNKLSDVLSLMGSNFGQDSKGAEVFHRKGIRSFKVVDADAYVGLAASSEKSPVDRVMVISKSSDKIALGDIAGILSSLANGGAWEPIYNNDSGPVWQNTSSGLQAGLNDRRNILLCIKSL